MYIGSEFMLLEANNEQLARENKKLAEALKGMLDFVETFNMGGDWYQGNYPAIKAAKQALMPEEECTCLPDLPDGRSRGHCYACEAESQRNIAFEPDGGDIPIGGE